MRYLKAYAQAKDCKGPADTVILQFYQHHSDCPDELVYEVIAVVADTGDKLIELRLGDIAPGALDMDKHQLEMFAIGVLKLNWFNAANHRQRTLTLYADYFGKTGRPNALKLDFYEPMVAGGKASLVYTAAAYDANSDGVLESFTNSDVDRNGVADNADKELIRTLCTVFLKWAWFDLQACRSWSKQEGPCVI
ncbi:hypothetical protein BK649_08285 [Pseudomonas canadensis]|uniref:Uncharacterized protein n=1 Tax=Pseudomonas canadensis TaxID=915099 RepID=A0A423FCU5_9PSED|nr:hypothetical protein [Pseudomonas canadensis]ROM54852.1 hypothetical protein BK649_08285 [Pseudomonas canadensis]